jgi:hypothetical protein
MVKRQSSPRKAAVVLEIAVVIPIMVLIVAIAVDISMGVFRYHQTATLAREGARYASVHGGQYSKDTNQPLLTGEKLQSDVLLPMSVSLNPSLLTCQLSWLPYGDPFPYSTTETGARKQNMVRVTVNYQWRPAFLFGTPINLTSTSETPISR